MRRPRGLFPTIAISHDKRSLRESLQRHLAVTRRPSLGKNAQQNLPAHYATVADGEQRNTPRVRHWRVRALGDWASSAEGATDPMANGTDEVQNCRLDSPRSKIAIGKLRYGTVLPGGLRSGFGRVVFAVPKQQRE